MSEPHAAGDRVVPVRLTRRLWALAGLHVAGLALVLLIHGSFRAPFRPQAGLALAALVLAYQWWTVRRRLADNRPHRATTLFSGFGPGTWVTLVRGSMLGMTAGFLLTSRPSGTLAWTPTILFTAAEILDYLDGYLARVSRHQTMLGEVLDLELDALGMLIGSALTVWYGALPWWFLAFGLARYLFALGLWIRRRRGLPVFPLPPSASRRPIAGLAMGFLSAALWPIVSQPATTLAGALFLAPFLGSFVRDWLVVSGTISSEDPRYLKVRAWAQRVLLEWVPLPLRAALVVTLWPMLAAKLLQFEEQVQRYSGLGFRPAELVVATFAILETLGVLAVGLGWAARVGSFLIVFPLGFTIVAAGLSDDRAVALVATLSILILGSGRWSIWKPEEQVFGRRQGGGGLEDAASE